MTGSDRDRPTPQGGAREAAPEPPSAPAARPTPAPLRPVVFGRRVQPPAAPPPDAATPARLDPVPPSVTPSATEVAPARHDPVPPSVTPPSPDPPPVQSPIGSPVPEAAAPPGIQPDPSRLNDEAYLAAEAIRLGIRVGDTAESAMDSDARLIAEARRLGIRTGHETSADWEEPFDDEMERTAILLGIRSEDALGKPPAQVRRAPTALPWIVLILLFMGAMAATTLFMDTIIEFFAQ